MLFSVQAYSQSESYYYKIIDICTNNIEKNNKLVENYKARGDANFSLGFYNLAISDYYRSIKLGNVSDLVYLNLGMSYYSINRIDSAIIILRKCESINSKNIDCKLYLSECFKSRRDFLNSKGILQKVLAIEKNNLNATYNLALVYKELKEFQNAINLFNLCINSNFLIQNSLLNISFCKAQLNKESEAWAMFNKARLIDSTNPFVYLYEGHILYKFKNIEKACEKYYFASEKGNIEARSFLKSYGCK